MAAAAPEHARANAFTVDLEEWFHVCGVGGALARHEWDHLPSRVDPTARLLLDMLDRAGVRATWFVVGWVAARHPRLVELIQSAGHEIGSHGYAHERAYDLGPAAFRSDLRDSLDALSAAGAPRATMFRAPEWSVNHRSLWALEAMAEEGIAVDASMAPVRIVGDVAFPRVPHVRRTTGGSVVEVPPFVADRLGHVMPIGWGWALRMSSPSRVLRAIEAANREGRPAVLTVHPWELDPDPPRVRLPPRLHFAHYFRLRGFRGRLQQILAGAAFGPIGAMALPGVRP
jgi:polysaccharide deacetylase family protein (PEP-CTERM system associated)